MECECGRCDICPACQAETEREWERQQAECEPAEIEEHIEEPLAPDDESPGAEAE